MRLRTIFITAHVFLLFLQSATAKELIAIQISRGPSIYTGSNACAIFADNRVIYHNEVLKPDGGNVLVMFEALDKSQMLWSSLVKKFNVDELAKKLDGIDTKREEAPAGSPSYRLKLFYSDKSSRSYKSLSNQSLISLYSYLERNCWDAARDCVPVIRKEYHADFYKRLITSE